MTDTNAMTPVMLDKNARMLKEAFSRCRRDVASPQHDEYARNLAKRVGSGRVRVAEHVITMAWNAFAREAPQEDVESFGHIYLAIVRSWYGLKRSGVTVDLPALIRGVLEAQGEATVAEFTCMAERSAKAIADAEEALTREEIAIERELEVLRALRYANDGNQAA